MLQSLKILEIEGLGPGPFAAMLLADLGAEVTVVHRPGPPQTPGKSEANLLDRGKRSIALDLKDPADREILLALAACADGLIEGFRPGVMERLGLGPDDLARVNPALVYGRMTGWGQEGPRAPQAGHDLNYIATSGALWYAGLPGDAPVTPATLVGDIGGGAMYLVTGLLAGILNARATGQGTVVDAAIVDGSAHMMALQMSLRAAGGMPETRGQGLLDGPHWSRSYACADGHVTVQALEPKFYTIFLDRMGLAADPDFARQFDRTLWPALSDRLAARFAEHPRAHWAALFDGFDACAAVVLSPDEAAADPHMSARGTWCTVDGRLQPRAAPRFGAAPPPDPRPAPSRDQDRATILKEIGR